MSLPPAGRWTPRDSLVGMIRGCIAKCRSLEREGVLSAKDSYNIRDALASAIIESQEARWREPNPDPGWEVLGTIPSPPAPAVKPLPTEAVRAAEPEVPQSVGGWWRLR